MGTPLEERTNPPAQECTGARREFALLSAGFHSGIGKAMDTMIGNRRCRRAVI